MEQAFCIADAINEFQQAVLLEELEVHPLDQHLSPKAAKKFCPEEFAASKADALESATALFNICAVIFARGRTGSKWFEEVSTPSIRNLLATIKRNASMEMTREEAWLERCDGLDIAGEILRLFLEDCVHSFRIYMHDCQLRELERAEIKDRVHSPQGRGVMHNEHPSVVGACSEEFFTSSEIP